MTSTARAGRVSGLLGAVWWFTGCWAWANTSCWLQPCRNVGVTTQLRCPPLAAISAPCNAEQKTQRFIEKAHKTYGVMAGPTPVRSNRFGVRCSAPPCPSALHRKASKTSPAREKKASPHQCDLTDSVPSISLNTGVGLSLPGLASLGHRERVGRGARQGQSTSRVHPLPL